MPYFYMPPTTHGQYPLSHLYKEYSEYNIQSVPSATGKTVMMFGCKNYPFHTGSNKSLHPLFAIQLRRIKCFGSESPYPHSRSLKVFRPKCTKAYVSIFCHSTCLVSGIGRIGSGAFTTGSQAQSKLKAAPTQKD